jgi:hypothetical protein
MELRWDWRISITLSIGTKRYWKQNEERFNIGKCGSRSVLTMLSTRILLSGGCEREMYVLQEMTSRVALSPLTLFCDIDTIHYSSKVSSPPPPLSTAFLCGVTHVIKIFVLSILKKGQMEF